MTSPDLPGCGHWFNGCPNSEHRIEKWTFGSSFGTLYFDNLLPAGISELDVAADLSVEGRISGGGDLGEVDLLYVPVVGDSDRDGEFNQLDIVQVLQAAKYRTGEPATFEQGDWNSDGLFDQLDIVAALQTANYLQGPYAAVDDAFADVAQ